MIDVSVSRRVMRKLKSEAERAFPKECFSALIGTRLDTGVFEISDIWIPSDLGKYSKNSCVIQPAHWVEQANEYAFDNDLEVLGSHHSHPWTIEELGDSKIKNVLYSCATPSRGDWYCEWSNLAGITAIVETEPATNGKKYGKLKSRTDFFGPATAVRLFTER
jgi:hypothetical protein